MAWLDALLAGGLRLDLLAKLGVATLLGGAIGWEREASGKPAGLRTNILICLGAALLTDLSLSFAALTAGGGGALEALRADPARIAAQVVSGIGFLGAGTILQAQGAVTGLTTAATLWVVAAIGMTVGAGAFMAGVGATALVLVVLIPLGQVESRIERRRRGRLVRLTLTDEPGVVERVVDILEGRGLDVRVESVDRDRKTGLLVLSVDVKGDSDPFRAARAEILRLDGLHALERV